MFHFHHKATFANCQAIITMKIAKKYAIMGNVNKTVFFEGDIMSTLYNVHKFYSRFL